jgi:hypothetical protein
VGHCQLGSMSQFTGGETGRRTLLLAGGYLPNLEPKVRKGRLGSGPGCYNQIRKEPKAWARLDQVGGRCDQPASGCHQPGFLRQSQVLDLIACSLLGSKMAKETSHRSLVVAMIQYFHWPGAPQSQ